MNDEIVLNTCFLANGNIKNIVVTNKYLDNHPTLKFYLLNRYKDIPSDYFSYREVIWRIKHNITKRPVCKTCGDAVSFIGKNSHDKNGKTINGYLRFCSPKCAQINQETRDKLKKTNICKYGVECTLQNIDVNRKAKDTMVRKYGVKNALESQILLEKAKKTTINTCGVYPSSKSIEVKEKRAATNIKKFGGLAPACNNDVLNKIKETNLKRYGCEYFLSSDKFHKLRDKFGSEWNNKVLNSLLANGTINHSIPEDIMFTLLTNIFNEQDVIRQYKSELYPFVCDFYIKPLELYIEYQGTYYHNFCFYNASRDEIKYRELLSKCTDEHPAYERVIKTWVYDDVAKFKTAIDNNLNMLFIYPYWSIEWSKLLKKTKKVDESKVMDDLRRAIYSCVNNKKQLIIGEKR